MCVIIRKPKGIEVSERVLRKCWEHNSNGAGFMYSEKGSLVVVKGLMKFQEFLKAYQDHNPIEKEVIIHFRLASHGKIVPEQTHPFVVGKSLGLVHNGIITFVEETTTECDDDAYLDMYPYGKQPKKASWLHINEKPESDTIEFRKTVLEKLPTGFEKNEGIKFLLDEFLKQHYSVVILMDEKGEVTMLGDTSSGQEKNGCWFSNMSWNIEAIKPFKLYNERMDYEEVYQDHSIFVL